MRMAWGTCRFSATRLARRSVKPPTNSAIAKRSSSARRNFAPPGGSSTTRAGSSRARSSAPASRRRSRRHLVAESLRVGRRAVRVRARRRDPGQHQPGVQDRRDRVCAHAIVDERAARPRARSARATTARCSPRCAAACRRCATRSCSTTTGKRCAAAGGACAPDALAAREATLSSTTRSTSSTPPAPPGFPKGATLSHHNILNNGYFVGRGDAPTPSATASASRCRSTTASAWCWATSPAPPRRVHGRPRRGVRRRCAVLETVAGRALHGALRRADDVHRRARSPAVRRVRPVARCAPASWPARPAPSR